MTDRARTILFWTAIVAAVLAVGLAVGPSPAGGPAFDPRSNSGNGTKALVELLRQFGAQVSLTADVPVGGVDVALVLDDRLSADRRDGLVRWAKAGGTLVVADPSSALQQSGAESVVHGLSSIDHVDGPCPEAGLDDVGRVDTGGSLLLALPPGATGCFPAGGDYLLVTDSLGAGRFVGLGGAGLFTNSLLGKHDNSVLAVDLLLPRPGAPVAVMLGSPVGGGRRSLWQLIGRPMRLALVQLLVAFAFVGIWRARRLGRPVSEEQPVQLAGSELTVAVGNLMARAGRRDAAAAQLRAGLRRWLGERLGLGQAATPEQLADAAAARSGLGHSRIAGLLEDRPVASDADLVELAQSIETARQEVAHGPV